MHESIKERFIFRNFLLLLLGIVIIFVLHKLHLAEEYKVVIDLLVLVFVTCLGIFLEFLVLPHRFRQKSLRTLMGGAGHAAEQSKTLDLILEQIVEQLRQNLDRVKGAFYIDQNETIPDLSLRTVQAVETSAFATFVADERERIYKNEQGREYIKAWYDKADELELQKKTRKGKHGQVGLHRVFILENFESVSDEMIELIEDHLAHHVKVSVIERSKADNIAKKADSELDFGLFDETCLMTVKTAHGGLSTLAVFVGLLSGENGARIAKYKKFRDKLLAEVTSANSFLSDFCRPPNADFWNYRFQEYGPMLGPPHGLSANDAREMVAFVLRHSAKRNEPLRVAVLGLTPELIKACDAEPLIGEIVLIDQTTVFVDLPEVKKKVLKVPSNWLTYNAKMNLDAVLGDESLNNLTVRQYRSFFRAMHSSVKPGGTLILRTLGRFGETDQFLSVAPQTFLDYVKNVPSGESEIVKAAKIIEFLHSKEIAFVEATQSLETNRYNSHLKKWCNTQHLTPQQAGPYYFPDSNSPALSLSSPTLSTVMEASRDYFSQSKAIRVDDSYRNSHTSLGLFYRITPFIRSEQ